VPTNQSTVQIPPEDFLQLKQHVRDALLTDGDHHKQWYLEQIHRILCQSDGKDPEELLRHCMRGIPG
jgi:hypothetical protein